MAFKPQATSGDTTKRYFWLGADWGQSVRVWVYVTSDGAATVAASGYITEQGLLDTIKTGDLVLVLEVGSISDSREVIDDVSTGGLIDVTLHMVSENTGSVIDLTDDLLGAALADGSVTTAKLADDAVTLAKIADAILSGIDATLITGTAGTDGNLAQWNADGDLVDGPGVLDEDDMASDSASAVPTQQSVKAYVDGTASGITDVVQDLTPQLGGNLDVNGRSIVSVSNGNIVIEPDGTGNVQLLAADVLVEEDIVHSGDTNNKIVFGTDTQDFQTGGSSRLDLSDSGVRLGGANARVTTVLDEDDMTSDSATALATQQSIKAYVDSISAGALAAVTVFTASGTWTPDAGATTALIIATGGGGGGGNVTAGSSGSGAGAGATAIDFVSDTSAVGTPTVTIGAAGTLGNNGGETSVGALAVAGGGSQGGAASSPGDGGTASAGDMLVPGGRGQKAGSVAPGAGGASFWGGQVSAYGAGGEGDRDGANGTAGVAGVVLILEW